MGLSTVRIVTQKGDAYLLKETDYCRYECPKPVGKVPYVAIGNEPNVIAYYPLGDQFLYTVSGCVDDSEAGQKVLNATFVSCKKK